MHNPFRYFNSSPEVIRLTVMMYTRYPLPLRQVEDVLFERGIDICHETVRPWWNRFGPMFAAEIRKRRVHDASYSRWRWHLDEVFVRINGKTYYLWRAVDHEGEVLEVFATKRRDRRAVLKFLKRTMKRYSLPRTIVTDRLDCQRRRKNVPARRRKSVPRAGFQLVPVVHGRDPRAGRCALRAAGGGPRVGGACGPTGSSGGLFGRLPAS